MNALEQTLKQGSKLEIKQRLFRKDRTHVILENSLAKNISFEVDESPEALNHTLTIKIKRRLKPSHP